MGEFINFCCNGDKKLIGITRYSVISANSEGKYRLPFNKISFNYQLLNR